VKLSSVVPSKKGKRQQTQIEIEEIPRELLFCFKNAMRVVRHVNRLSTEAAESPSLEILKTLMEPAPGSLLLMTLL